MQRLDAGRRRTPLGRLMCNAEQGLGKLRHKTPDDITRSGYI
jgi:hypothetical protein